MENMDKRLAERLAVTQIRGGVVMFVFGIVLVVGGFIVPPVGVIDNSILIALGEILAFAGALLSVAPYKRKKSADPDGEA